MWGTTPANSLPSIIIVQETIYQLGKYPINLTSFSKFLSFYPNKSDSIELLKGFQQGFSLNYQDPRLPTDANNLPSARKYPDILQGKIDKDDEAGRIAGPFVSRPSFANIEDITVRSGLQKKTGILGSYIIYLIQL